MTSSARLVYASMPNSQVIYKEWEYLIRTNNLLNLNKIKRVWNDLIIGIGLCNNFV